MLLWVSLIDLSDAEKYMQETKYITREKKIKQLYLSSKWHITIQA
jgi:hypothetical protein